MCVCTCVYVYMCVCVCVCSTDYEKMCEKCGAGLWHQSTQRAYGNRDEFNINMKHDKAFAVWNRAAYYSNFFEGIIIIIIFIVIIIVIIIIIIIIIII